MWKILKTEILYKKNALILLFLLSSVVVYYEIWRAENNFRMLNPEFIKAWLIFIFVQNWIIYRNKYNREEWITTLPIAPLKIAAIRYSMILVYGLGFYLLCLAQISLFGRFELVQWKEMGVGMAFNLFIFSLYFLGRDLFVNFFINLGWTKDRVLPAFVMLTLGLNIFTVFLFLQAKQKKGALLKVGQAIEYALQNNPFVGEYGFERFIGLVLILILCSLIAFRQQKSYIKNRSTLNRRA